VFPPILVINWVFILAFIFPERVHYCCIYIFTAPTCTTTIITLKPCALNAKFQYFILRFNKISLLCGCHWKRGEGAKAGPKTGRREGHFMDNSNTCPEFQTPIFGFLQNWKGGHYKFSRKMDWSKFYKTFVASHIFWFPCTIDCSHDFELMRVRGNCLFVLVEGNKGCYAL
jgi:hypothetical protein